MRARCLADQNGDETLFRLMFVDITVVVIVIALDLWPHSSVWTLECFLHAEPSPVSPIFLHCVISRMCIQMKREKRWHSFFFPSLSFTFSPLREHVHRVSVALWLPFRTAAPARSPHTHAYAHYEAISHHFCTTSQLLTFMKPCHRCSCPSTPLCLSRLYYSLCFHTFPLPASLPPLPLILCHYSCVSAVGLSQSTQRWSWNVKGLQGRQPGPSVSPSCHSHFRLPLIIKASFFLLASPSEVFFCFFFKFL